MKNLFELKEHRYESMETENIIINFKRKKVSEGDNALILISFVFRECLYFQKDTCSLGWMGIDLIYGH